MTFSNNLVKYRKLSGLTQENIAQLCNVSRQAVTKWESGTCLPDVYTIDKIAKCIGITLEELIYNKDENALSKIWNSTKEKIKERMEDSSFQFELYINRLELIHEFQEDRKIFLRCKNELMKNIVECEYMDVIEDCIYEITNEKYDVIICN